MLLFAGAFLYADRVEGGSASAEMKVSVRVLGRTVVTVEGEPQSLVITESDVARGYVEIPSALRFRIHSNEPQGYRLRFDLQTDAFRAAHVSWGHTTVRVNALQEGWIGQMYSREPQSVAATVRLELGREVMAGTYPWPVSVSADSL